MSEFKEQFNLVINEFNEMIKDIYDDLNYYFDVNEQETYCYKNGEIKYSTIINFIKNTNY
jgi:predicted methyltransferase